MQCVKRHYVFDESYRFSFQNQEADDEWAGSGNMLAFKYRIHDVRLGRFLSVDPLAPDYPWNSPYAFSENSVIAFVELEGLEKLSANDSKVMIVGGMVMLNIKNLHPTSQSAINRANEKGPWPSGQIGNDLRVQSFNWAITLPKAIDGDPICLDNTFGATDPNYNPSILKVPIPLTKEGQPNKSYKERVLDLGSTGRGGDGVFGIMGNVSY
jgi:RHS repeat-associated protein